MQPTEIKKAILPVSVATLIGIVLWAIGLTMKYSETLHNIDRRIMAVETQMWQWGGFTTKDGDYIKQDLEQLEKTKADRSDLKVIEVKLANIEAMLIELKKDFKK